MTLPISRCRWLVAASALGCFLCAPPLHTQNRNRPYVAWRDYAGSPDSMQYSALDQINTGNVAALQPAWFYPVPGEPERLPFNPLVIDDVMYVAGAGGAVVALDAATGKHRWTSAQQATERGLT